MKILLVSSSFFPKVDGSTRCVYDHARKLVERGHEVYLVTRAVQIRRAGKFGTGRYEELEGIKIFRSRTLARSSTGLSLDKLRITLEQILLVLSLQRKVRFDVIHVHGYSACYSALPCKFFYRIPLVITTHGTELLWPASVRWKTPSQLTLERLFEKLALTLCDVIIAQSKGVREYMLKLYGSAIESKIQIIPTGVDHTKFLQLPKLTGDKEILFVGALSEIKGVNGLITSFSRVHHKLDDSKLVLAGSGPNAPRYEKLVRELKLENSVEFLGPVRDDRRMIELYRNSNVVVLPSNVGGPISCTILEGLSSGRPVISTNVPGGIPDVVDDAVGGLIAPEDIDSLTEKLFRFLQDKEYADQIGYNARQRIVEKYTLDLMIDELLSLYTELAA